MKNSWSLDHHHLQLLLHAVERQVLQGPVPVVIIILNVLPWSSQKWRILSTPYLKKLFTTSYNLIPFFPCKTHPHVVQAIHPLANLNLEQRLMKENITILWKDLLIKCKCKQQRYQMQLCERVSRNKTKCKSINIDNIDICRYFLQLKETKQL